MVVNQYALYEALLADVGHLLLSEKGQDVPPDSSVEQYAAAALRRSLLRKWEVTSDAADSAALLKFLEADNRCERWELALESTVDEQLWGNLRCEIDRFFFKGPDLLFSSYYDLLRSGEVGPGSAIGARGESLYAKLFASPLTVTSASLYAMYRDYVQWHYDWGVGEYQRNSVFGSCVIARGSRVTFVPKNVDISRLICVEPSLNMFVQKGLSAIFENRMRELWSVDHALQPTFNRELAWEGSLTGGFATIDLESASDSVSLNLLRALLPEYVFETLVETRSPEVFLPGLGWRKLNMVSTMGNGWTFSLQSILFSCIVRAAYKSVHLDLVENSRFGHGNWAVFGDDLIVDSRAVRAVMRLLHLTGFRVNSSKSFFEGPFRESCGCDFYKGHNVRGVYIKRLDRQQDFVIAINLLNEWSARTAIPLRNCVSWLKSQLRELLLVPYQDNNECGVRVPSSLLPPGLGHLPLTYKRFVAQPKVVRIEDGTIRVPRGCKKLIWNPHGLLVSFLRGEIRQGMIAVRHDRVRFRTKTGCVPWWDFMPVESIPFGNEVDWLRWKSAVEVNMS